MRRLTGPTGLVSLRVESLESRTFLTTTPNDVYFPLQWWMQNVSAPQAWDLTTGSSRVVVDVNDTGIDYTHPDLYLNIWLNQKEIPFPVGGKKGLQDTDADGLITFWDLNARQGGKLVNGSFARDVNANGYIDAGDLLHDARWEDGVDNGANGYTDDLVGWDFVNGDNDPMDDFFHGTHVAGIIGSGGNNVEGGAGIAWRVQLMATKILDQTGRGDASIEDPGIHYAADNGARVSNNSWGGTNLSKRQFTLLYNGADYARSKGVLYVANAGNNGDDNDYDHPTQYFPATLDLPNVISVAASDVNDQLAPFSNYGRTTVDLAAPGDQIGSTIPVNQNPAAPYAFASGTSQAAPHVAGAAALLLARNPGLSYAQLKSLILDNVDPLPAFAGKTVTGGRLNLFRALAATPVAMVAASPGAAAPPRLFSTTPVGSDADLLGATSALLT